MSKSETTTEDSVTTTTLTDKELLKQKKEEAKIKKTAEKEEKKASKEERKHAPQKLAKEKASQKRNPLKIHSKKWRAAAEKIKKDKLYSFDEGIKLIKETSTTKFDSSVEIHSCLGINPKKSDQIVRATVALPNGTGKKLRVIALVPAEKAKEAKSAGAIEAGEDDLIEKIGKGWLDFDVAIATPEMMKKLGKVAKTLGQKGLMPNPKAGTVTTDIKATITEIQKGKVEFRADSYGILHNIVGKVSFENSKLVENLKAYLHAVRDAKPKTVKCVYFKSLSITTSMGPGIKIDPKEI